MSIVNILNAKIYTHGEDPLFLQMIGADGGSKAFETSGSYASEGTSIVTGSLPTPFGNLGVSEMDGQFLAQGLGGIVRSNLTSVKGAVNVIYDDVHNAVVIQSDEASFTAQAGGSLFTDVADKGHCVVIHPNAMNAAQVADYAAAVKGQMGQQIAQGAASQVHAAAAANDSVNASIMHFSDPFAAAPTMPGLSEAVSNNVSAINEALGSLMHALPPSLARAGVGIFVLAVDYVLVREFARISFEAQNPMPKTERPLFSSFKARAEGLHR